MLIEVMRPKSPGPLFGMIFQCLDRDSLKARELMNIARRIAAILLLEPSLDGNYQAIKNSTYSWPEGD